MITALVELCRSKEYCQYFLSTHLANLLQSALSLKNSKVYSLVLSWCESINAEYWDKRQIEFMVEFYKEVIGEKVYFSLKWLIFSSPLIAALLLFPF